MTTEPTQPQPEMGSAQTNGLGPSQGHRRRRRRRKNKSSQQPGTPQPQQAQAQPPQMQAPPQPLKLQPDTGEALRVTDVPLEYVWLHALPQLM